MSFPISIPDSYFNTPRPVPCKKIFCCTFCSDEFTSKIKAKHHQRKCGTRDKVILKLENELRIERIKNAAYNQPYNNVMPTTPKI